jgi:hypothetical protein
MSGLRVYSAITAITAELARCGIAKSKINEAEQYAYRGIDDVMEALAPLLAKHRLCVLPRVLERTSCDRASADGEPAISVAIKIAFDIVSARDGSSHTIEAYGEALDSADKATSKAMSSAYKSAMVQAFCIPVRGSDEPELGSNRPKASNEQPDPDQGWDQWARDIEDMVRVCETGEALDRVQSTYRTILRAASKRRPDLYAAIGAAVQARRLALKPPLPNRDLNQRSARKDRGKRDSAKEVLVHA